MIFFRAIGVSGSSNSVAHAAAIIEGDATDLIMGGKILFDLSGHSQPQIQSSHIPNTCFKQLRQFKSCAKA